MKVTILIVIALVPVLVTLLNNSWSKDIITLPIGQGNIPYSISIWSSLAALTILILNAADTVLNIGLINWPNHPSSRPLFTSFLTFALSLDISVLFALLLSLGFICRVLIKHGTIIPKKEFNHLKFTTTIDGCPTDVWIIKEAPHDTYIVVESIEDLNNSVFIALPASSLQNKIFTYSKIPSKSSKRNNKTTQ